MSIFSRKQIATFACESSIDRPDPIAKDSTLGISKEGVEANLMTENKFGLGNHNFSEDEIAEMMSPAIAQKKMQEAKHKELIWQILSGDVEDNAGPYEMRCIVENDLWFVPIKSDGKFQILNVKKGEFARLYAAVSKKDGRRTVREGRGGQLLPIYRQLPDGADREDFAQIDGRQLARTLPSNITGLLVERQSDEPLRELDSEYFPTLRGLADAIELEDALMAGGRIKSELLLNYRFRVAMYNDRLWQRRELASIATFADKQFFDSVEITVVEMSGKEIFTRILEDGTYAGAILNPGHDLGRHGEMFRGLMLSLNLIDRLLHQDETTLGLEQYIVRSRAEFEEWLTHVYFPKPYQIIEEEDLSGKSFIWATATGVNLEWSILECETFCERLSQVETPKFELRSAPGSEDDLAAGRSQVLCPARLARNLFLQLPERNRRDFIWAPGKNVGLGRILSAKDVEASRERVKLATELLKLIDGSQAISPRTMLSVDGAQFVQELPKLAARAWAESALQQAKRYCKPFVIG